ncbi:MAG: hypothetical protein IJH91_01090 [Mogibacterium sp.]|nr:hypothetical protein [Mogibacterium sp.]
MKTKRTALLAVLLALVMLLASCGGSKGVAKGEQFTLGDYTYALEKVERSGDKCTVTLLLVGDQVPVILTSDGAGGMVTKVGILMRMGEGDDAINATEISINAVDDVEGYGGRMGFTFTLPADAELPETATAINGFDEKETVVLDLTSAL